jgi:hypothetical protein
VDRLHVKRNNIVGMNYLGIIDNMAGLDNRPKIGIVARKGRLTSPKWAGLVYCLNNML